jgi:Flp pilus assembly pilin Flp
LRGVSRRAAPSGAARFAVRGVHMRSRDSALARLRRLATGESGQDLVEYGLLASLIATFLIGATNLVGDQVEAIWQVIAGIQY